MRECDHFWQEIGVEGAGTLRQHAGQISIEGKAFLSVASLRGPYASTLITLWRRLDFPLAVHSTQQPIESPKEEQWQARQVRFGQVH